MFLVTLTLALAALAQAQDSSSTTISSQIQSTQSKDSSAVQSTSQFKLPLYPPYPISSTTNAPASASASGSASASTSSRSSSSVTAYQSDKYWQHTYRDYYASIITVLSTSTLVYQIDCAPNSAHPSYREPDFQSFDVCAARIVGRGPMTVTQGPSQWNFAVSETEASLNLTQTRFNDATTSTRLDVTCEALQEKTKTCKNVNALDANRTTSAVAAPSLPSGRRSSSSVSISGDGASQQRESQVSALLENFSTMSEVMVTVTGGFDQLSPSIMSSLMNDASGAVSLNSQSPSPSPSQSAGASQSVSTGGAPARPTGAVRLEVMFGAAGLLGAAVFGL